MQTFLPYSSFGDSAHALDRMRLGKQRVEAKQIILAAERGPGAAWYNHPATIMWRDYLPALCNYAIFMCREWRDRGYVDNLHEFFGSRLSKVVRDVGDPWWLGDERLHSSHRAALLHKAEIRLFTRDDPSYFDWYAKFGWSEEPQEAYWWPGVKNNGTREAISR